MKKKLVAVLMVVAVMSQLVACSLGCKADGCDEKEIYEDGYCKYHYYLNVGENAIKDILN